MELQWHRSALYNRIWYSLTWRSWEALGRPSTNLPIYSSLRPALRIYFTHNLSDHVVPSKGNLYSSYEYSTLLAFNFCYVFSSEKCGLGSQLVSGDKCQPCPLGTYKASVNESFCSSCLIVNGMQTTTYSAGATSARECKGIVFIFTDSFYCLERMLNRSLLKTSHLKVFISCLGF